MEFIGGQTVVLKEYDSTVESAKERLFVKPAEQLNIVVIDAEKQKINLGGWIKRIFLPEGYPNSVSNDYMSYQIWDTAQAFCSTITGTLATNEILTVIGVGDAAANALSATTIVVFRDGFGHLGRILFAYSHGSFLDSSSKNWRMYADILNDAALCVELSLTLFQDYAVVALIGSTIMKSIVGVAGSATRVAMTRHHALQGNIGDVSAKDSAQETAVNLVASLTTLLLMTLFRSNMFLIILTMSLHVIFNYLAVRAVCLNSLNEARYLLVIDKYLTTQVVPTPREINDIEPILFSQTALNKNLSRFKVKIGSSLTHLIKTSPKASYLQKILEIYSHKRYIVYPDTKLRVVHVFLKDNCTTDDILCAYFHAVVLGVITFTLNSNELLLDMPILRSCAEVCKKIQKEELKRVGSFNNKLSCEVLRHVRNTVTGEWSSLKMGLVRIGWDLSKHLIMVDKWRIYKDNTTPEPSPSELFLETSNPYEKSTHSSEESCTIEPAINETESVPSKKKLNINEM